MDGSKDFDNGQPYCAIAGELVADALAVAHIVKALRPKVATFPGTLHVTVDVRAGSIIVALLQGDGRLLLVERILCDPQQPSEFGASALPTVPLDAAAGPVMSH